MKNMGLAKLLSGAHAVCSHGSLESQSIILAWCTRKRSY
uniref:Uncharacterized protein n=1 Tax=Rhizophora mucronata TaxID=61149 RepID=A0A2P2QFZ6_RHIMU